MPFRVTLSKKAAKFINNAEKQLRNRLIEKLERLGDDPFPPDAKRVIGTSAKAFRVRVGDYRILYMVIFDDKTIVVSDIDKRSNVYDR